MSLVYLSKKGFSLLELILVVTLILILISIALPNLSSALRIARETRAIANIKTLTNIQQTFYTNNNKFAVIDELFTQNYLTAQQFLYLKNPTNSKLSATDTISDGYYLYSFRYSIDASGYSLDADPKKEISNQYRFFRYRFSRLIQNKNAYFNDDLIFFALPRKDFSSPASSAYQPLN
jgi:prepilin-type N-terminal cleavage/methylation domain-containing protein